MDEDALQWSSHENACWPRCYSTRKYDRFVSSSVPVKRPNAPPIWRQIWNKFKKEKKRIFHCSDSTRFTYDPHSYSQNFDHGSMCTDDHDDLSRSFSARFAVPSRIFDKPRLMV